jgi:hypothetical protein
VVAIWSIERRERKTVETYVVGNWWRMCFYLSFDEAPVPYPIIERQYVSLKDFVWRNEAAMPLESHDLA